MHFYNSGISGLDILKYINDDIRKPHISKYCGFDDIKISEFTIYFNKIKFEYRCEQLLIFKILFFLFEDYIQSVEPQTLNA